MHRGKQRYIQLLDLTLFIATLVLTIKIRAISNLFVFKQTFAFFLFEHTYLIYGTAALIYITTLYLTGQYEFKIKFGIGNLIIAGLFNAIVLFFWIILFPYLFMFDIHPRSFIITFLIFNFVAFILSRLLLKFFSRNVRYNVVVVGSAEKSKTMLKMLRSFHDFAMNIQGAVVPENESDKRNVYVYPVLGKFKEISTIVNRFGTDIVIICEDIYERKMEVLDAINYTSYKQAHFYIVPNNYEIILSTPDYLRIHDSPLVRINKVNHFLLPIKRLFDFTAALVLVVLAAPVMLFTAFLVRVTSKGPIVFCQNRVGLGEKIFKIYKFRTMYTDFESKVYQAKRGKDERLTPIGKLLRVTRLDELPQLLNVLKGDMSFIGPRPLVEKEVQIGLETVHSYRERFSVLPGVTGLAQVHGDYYTQPEIKIKYDLWYVHHYSLMLDFTIILRTIQTVLLRKGS